MRSFHLLSALIFLVAVSPLPAGSARTVVVTLDDLPYVGGSLPGARRATDQMLAALSKHGAQASVFVQGTHVDVAGERDARLSLLRRWNAAGHSLENHGYSHLPFNDTPTEVYLADLIRGHDLVAALRTEEGTGPVGFFRAPYNQTGATREARDALDSLLAAHAIRLAPFTVEDSDWMFNTLYEDALTRGDDEAASRVRDAYLHQLDIAFEFAERLSAETFDRQIPQVFLIHANRINGDSLDTMLDRLVRRGYRFVALEEALGDPVYDRADGYVGRWGISWLHRWRARLGLPKALNREPDPPGWILQAYQDRNNANKQN